MPPAVAPGSAWLVITNAPVPEDDTVPSARAERRRIVFDNVTGLALYAVAVAVILGALLVVVLFAAHG